MVLWCCTVFVGCSTMFLRRSIPPSNRVTHRSPPNPEGKARIGRHVYGSACASRNEHHLTFLLNACPTATRTPAVFAVQRRTCARALPFSARSIRVSVLSSVPEEKRHRRLSNSNVDSGGTLVHLPAGGANRRLKH